MTKDTATVTLTGWLLEQIAADEADARDRGEELQGEVLRNSRHTLAVCAAHRKIVEEAERIAAIPQNESVARAASHLSMDWVVTVVASAYANRDGYRDEWRP